MRSEPAFGLRYGSQVILVWANVRANDGILFSHAISRQNDEAALPAVIELTEGPLPVGLRHRRARQPSRPAELPPS
jgi:hypothetical protein